MFYTVTAGNPRVPDLCANFVWMTLMKGAQTAFEKSMNQAKVSRERKKGETVGTKAKMWSEITLTLGFNCMLVSMTVCFPQENLC